MSERLPIDEVLPAILDHLKRHPNLVVQAAPGAGKTTRVPPAMLDAGLIPKRERLIMLEPRRVAARSAARRIASERRGRLGDEVGYKVRFDDRTSKRTRLMIVTEGMLARQLQGDPTLEGVAAVVLDEFHERSIHTDLALAFLREIQQTIRPELRIVVMSATLETGPIARYLGDCPVVESAGRTHPVERIWLERPDERRVVEKTVSGVRRALKGDDGDMLVFLPGAGEIQRTCDALRSVVDGIDLRPMYGALDTRAQDAAIAPGPRRKIVVATNIAESSITIEGVTTVVDSGLEKIVRHDPSRGIDRLDTVFISHASAKQRAGRAGRTRPGRAFHLWTASEDRRLADAATPEIARADLASVLLDVVAWSGADPREFDWFEAPPGPMIERALSLLRTLGAIERDRFRLTERGKTFRAFPLHPRIAATMVAAHARGVVSQGALLAALASERDIARRGAARDMSGPSDLLLRAELYEELARTRFSRSFAERVGLDAGAARAIGPVRNQLEKTARRVLGEPGRLKGDEEEALMRVLLAGFADRVAKRRSPDSDRVRMVGGRGGRLAPESAVKSAELMVAIDLDDSKRRGTTAADSLVRIASSVELRWLEEDTDGVHDRTVVRFNTQRNAAEAVRERCYEDLVLSSERDTRADPAPLAEALAEAASEDLPRALDLKRIEPLRRRVALLRRAMPELELPPLDEDGLKALLPALCYGLRSFADLKKADLISAVRTHLGHHKASALDRHAPERITVAGRRPMKLRYEADGPPVLSARLQLLFGVHRTPAVASGRVPIKMELLAPNMRPVQVTQDLESFWTNTYPEVRKQLRARYPKHKWPEDPRTG